VTVADLNTEFLQVFEAIKLVVNRLAGKENSREFELFEACQKNTRVRNRKPEIEYIKDVRNLLVHQVQSSGLPTFALTATFIDFCRNLHDQISQATTAGQLGVRNSDLCTATWASQIHPLISKMRSEKFSHIPILNNDGVAVGVFNESAILDYLIASGMSSLIEPEHTLKEIYKHCVIGADHVETFRFISPRASEEDVADIFLSVTGPFTRVGAVFVTPGAAPHEPIQRMITAWDVLSQSKGTNQ
jgi:CBS domain-containing protein